MDIESPLTDSEKNTLRKWQKLQVSILKNYQNFMAFHKLAYWMDAGTVLGAYRHQGFVPWDDDIDLAMFHDDFFRLKNMILSDPNLGKDFNLCFNLDRFGIDQQYIGLASLPLLYNNEGIAVFTIDIYCVGRFRMKNLASWLKVKRYSVFCNPRYLGLREFYFDHGSLTNKERVKYIFRLKPFEFRTALLVIWILPLLLSLLRSPNGSLVEYHHLSRFSFSSALDVDAVLPLQKVPFGGHMFYGPANLLKYNQALFGEQYHEYPPMENRKPHHFDIKQIEKWVQTG